MVKFFDTCNYCLLWRFGTCLVRIEQRSFFYVRKKYPYEIQTSLSIWKKKSKDVKGMRFWYDDFNDSIYIR